MTTSPSSLSPEHNMKNREVYCPNCKTYSMTEDKAPTCKECFGTQLITVVYSVVSGNRITGNDELAQRNS